MKKFFSLVLALVMALSLTTVAWGAPTAEETALQTALNAGGTVTLSGDVVVNDGLTVPANTTVTIDLNGFKLYAGDANRTFSAAFTMITNRGTLTIKDGSTAQTGKIELAGEIHDANYATYGFPTIAINAITNGGTLTLESGTISVTADKDATTPKVATYAVDNNSGNGNAILNINGGTLINEHNTAIRQFCNSTTYKNEVNITAGEVTGTRAVWIQLPSSNSALEQKAALNVEGGTLTATGTSDGYNLAVYSYSYGASSTATEINISGGTFEGDVAIGGGAKNGSETMNITGGTFEGEVYTYNTDTTETSGKIEISDGTFAVAPPMEFVTDGLRYDSATGELTAMPTTGVGKYDLYDANGDLYKENITVEYVEAYDDEGAGNIDYYKLTYDGVTYTYFVECNRTKAECYLTLADNLGAYKHLKHVDYVDYVATGKTYTNIGDDCGELDVSAKAKAYVVTDEDGVKTYFVASAAGQKVIKVGNELVAVNEVVGGLVPHVWVVTAYNDKEEPATVKCKNCPATGKLYATKLAAPIGATFDDTQVAGYWVVVNGSAAPSTDKTVTSADTFDAGIAMYVGMSVMAAAGSAVVIGKKKD